MNFKKAILVTLLISIFVVGMVSTVSATSTKATLKVTAPKVTNTYKQSQSFKVTVKNQKTGKAMKNVKATIKIDKKTYNKKTNKKGIIIINTKSLKKGTHKVTIKIKATKKYKKASAKSTIKIVKKSDTNTNQTTSKEKIETHFTIKEIRYSRSGNGALKGAHVTLNLVDANGKILHKSIKGSMRRWDYDTFWYVNVGDVVTGKSGEEMYLTCDDWGADQIFVSFAGDEDYESSSYTIKI